MLQINGCNYFSYDMVGEFHSEGPWIHPRRRIKSYELILMLEGCAYIAEEDHFYELKENHMLLLDPDKEHYGYQESLSQTSFYWFHFYTDLAMPFKYCSQGDVYSIKYLLKLLLHITNTISTPEYAADSAGLLVFEELCRCSKQTMDDTSLIHRISEYARIHASQNISVSDVAAHFGYHPDYITRLFKKQFHMGFGEYLASLRIKVARDLLLNTRLTVKQIACELNFQSSGAFIKFFMYHEKISPTAFRNSCFHTHMNNQ
ncbi:MAG: helix-turn-helix domain-containing protein [Lachnospiraceae bacterium]|nr:helix-turn-helix domain-containing protein [Lachnospiraceae bacterium]